MFEIDFAELLDIDRACVSYTGCVSDDDYVLLTGLTSYSQRTCEPTHFMEHPKYRNASTPASILIRI
jgi:hypothetical protein